MPIMGPLRKALVPTAGLEPAIYVTLFESAALPFRHVGTTFGSPGRERADTLTLSKSASSALGYRAVTLVR